MSAPIQTRMVRERPLCRPLALLLAVCLALAGCASPLDERDSRNALPEFNTPGLSMQSFGIGGAALEGRIVAADGTETPIAYRWYETDIRESYAHWVWTDAEFAFDRFARKLASGGEFARR